MISSPLHPGPEQVRHDSTEPAKLRTVGIGFPRAHTEAVWSAQGTRGAQHELNEHALSVLAQSLASRASTRFPVAAQIRRQRGHLGCTNVLVATPPPPSLDLACRADS